MNTDELIKKVKDYLIKKNISYIDGSIKYNGFRENFKQVDGSEKSVYAVSFMASISNQQYGGEAFYFVHIDAKTDKLAYIIGPQSLKKVEE
ncbi:hypothetical protein [uncultured Chryseobacterium sp.]|uniref:hypothetical protein n=1 Tax=uncultured Chryseobacterium sp. TaxID=259322 RepID=UPI0025ECB925|nr:hypothetical protein [uncultured Chryseobacterium sp.]